MKIFTTVVSVSCGNQTINKDYEDTSTVSNEQIRDLINANKFKGVCKVSITDPVKTQRKFEARVIGDKLIITKEVLRTDELANMGVDVAQASIDSLKAYINLDLDQERYLFALNKTRADLDEAVKAKRTLEWMSVPDSLLVAMQNKVLVDWVELTM